MVGGENTGNKKHITDMQVETYEVEQPTSEIAEMANDGAAVELIEKMGLDGQKRILDPKTNTRNPYRAMEAVELRIYGALLTEHQKLKDYGNDAIPLRVLQVACHANDCGMFDDLEVWSATPAVSIDDPILVGTTQRKARWGGQETCYFLLARWGKSLLPLEQLEAIAVKLLRFKTLGKLRAIQREVASRITEIEESNDIAEVASQPCFSK